MHPPVYVLIPTHTTRHLDTCLASLGAQSAAPAAVVVTCDTDAPEIPGLLEEVWPLVAARMRSSGREPPPLVYAGRPHQGEARLNQVRNNGLRALEVEGLLRPEGHLLVLDGDTVLFPPGVEAHALHAARGADLVITFRINLDERATAALTPAVLLRDSSVLPIPPGARAALRRRQRRYARQLFLRRVAPRLVKPHKPKILGGHHGVSLARLRDLNGYDEEYVGYGYDDDDLSRRLYALRPPPHVAIAVDEILALHLWHPSRAPARPTDAPGYERFRRSRAAVAEFGWRTPISQPAPLVRRIRAN